MNTSQFLAQAKNIWNSMGAGPRVTLLAFVGLTVVLVAVLGFWSAQPDFVLLYGGLSPEDAASISTRLRDDKVPFRYEASRGAILIPAARVDGLRLGLAAQGLPRNSTEGFELFDKTSFGATEFVQKVNYQRALQGTLARNIQSLDAVDSARVSLSIPEESLFARDKQEAKASIVVSLRAGRSLSGEQVGAIRHLVASSVPKLEPRNVTIVDSTGRILSRPQEAGNAAAMSDEHLEAQKRVENHFTDKVQSLLDQVVGKEQSVVRVTAQLNFERVERTSEKMDPETQALLEESSTNQDQIGKSSGAGGVPGVASNTTPATTPTTEGGGSNSKKQKTISNRYHYDTITERMTSQVGAVKRLSVAVLVSPKAKIGGDKAGGDKAAPVARTAQELAALTEIVRSAVGFSTERQDVIKVEELPFAAAGDGAAAAPAPAPALPWLELVQRHLSDALAFLGIVVMLVIFRRMLSRVPVPAMSSAEMQSSATVNMEPQSSPTVLMQEDLKRMVTQNNTQAVSIIRSMLK